MKPFLPLAVISASATIAGAASAYAHTARQGHDMLHNSGYDRVRYVAQRTDYDGKPIYTYRACDGRKAYRIAVNWYGDIVSERRAGWCFGSKW